MKWNLVPTLELRGTWNALGLVRPGELVLDLNRMVVMSLGSPAVTVKTRLLVIGVRADHLLVQVKRCG